VSRAGPNAEGRGCRVDYGLEEKMWNWMMGGMILILFTGGRVQAHVAFPRD
jgi:hypothetical protein